MTADGHADLNSCSPIVKNSISKCLKGLYARNLLKHVVHFLTMQIPNETAKKEQLRWKLGQIRRGRRSLLCIFSSGT